MGIGTLIIFISLLFVAAIAAGVLIQSTQTLQEKAHTTGKQTKSQVSTALMINEMTLEKESNGDYRTIKAIAKLAPGSESITLDDLILTISSYDGSVSLDYSENGTLTPGQEGYYSQGDQEISTAIGIWQELEAGQINSAAWNPLNSVDYDLDGTADSVRFCWGGASPCAAPYRDGRHIAFNLSSDPTNLIYVQMTSDGVTPINSICNIGGAQPINTDANVGPYGRVIITGTVCQTCCYVGFGAGYDPDVYYRLHETNLTEDLDGDGNSSDFMYATSTTMVLNFSNGSVFTIPLGVDISTAGQTIEIEQILGNPSGYIGKLEISGTTALDRVLDLGMEITVAPKTYAGAFVVDYLQHGQNSRVGVISYGDVVQFYLQAPRSMQEDDLIMFTLIPKNGMPTRIETTTKSVMNTDVVSIYP